MSDFSVFVPISEAEPGMIIHVGTLVVEGDCGFMVYGKSESVHKNNILYIGDIGLEEPENGSSSMWYMLDVPAGTYEVTYYIGERGLGEQPVGASFDFTAVEEVCQITTTTIQPPPPETTTTTVPVTTTIPPTTTSSSTTSTTAPPVTTTVPDSTTTTEWETTTTTEIGTPTLPETGPPLEADVLSSMAFAGVALVVLGGMVVRALRERF